MKFFFVANSSWYLKNFRSSTIYDFASKGEVVCAFPRGKDSSDVYIPGAFNETFYMDSTSLNPVKELAALISLIFLLARQRPDVVFTFNPKTNLYSLMACWLLRIKCVPNVSGVGVASQLNGVVGKIYNALSGFFYRRAAFVFFQNENDHRNFLEAGWIKPSSAEVIPGSGVDLERFRPSVGENGKMRFLMAARLIEPKGVLEYLEAAREVLRDSKDCEFYLAGVKDSSNRAVPESVLASLESETDIHFLGHVENMPQLLDDMDCFILPSYYPEGIPKSLLEAAASGKMIVTTDTPGCREAVIEGKNGYLVEPRSVDGLVHAIRKIMESSHGERENMKNFSRDLAEKRFDEKTVVRRYFEAANRLVVS